jgi:hypothetical protein
MFINRKEKKVMYPKHPFFSRPVYEFELVLDKLIETTKQNALLEERRKNTQQLEHKLAHADSQLKYAADDIGTLKTKLKESRALVRKQNPKA